MKEEVVDSKTIIGRFVGKYIVLTVIIGGFSFLLENLIPQIANWGFRSSVFLIFQSVLFIISTLLATTLAVSSSIKKVKIKSEEEAEKITAPIVTILIIIALFLLGINLIYCSQLEKSEKHDIEEYYKPVVVGEENEFNDLRKEVEIKDAHVVSTVFMATKEILIILTYSYVAIYIDKMVRASVEKDDKKKVVETSKVTETAKTATATKSTTPKAAPKTTTKTTTKSTTAKKNTTKK